MRREGLRRTSPSCRSCCVEVGAGSDVRFTQSGHRTNVLAAARFDSSTGPPYWIAAILDQSQRLAALIDMNGSASCHVASLSWGPPGGDPWSTPSDLIASATGPFS